MKLRAIPLQPVTFAQPPERLSGSALGTVTSSSARQDTYWRQLRTLQETLQKKKKKPSTEGTKTTVILSDIQQDP